MMIINKPQPNISIQGTPRFKGHYKAYQGCPLNKGSTVVLKKPWLFFVNHSPATRDLQAFLVFSQHPKLSQVGYHTGKPIERVVYCFYKIWIVDWSEILIMTLLIRVKARYE